MITPADYFMGRDVQFAAELTPVIEANAERMIRAANVGMAMFYADTGEHARHVNSGWRPAQVNDHTANAAEHSPHLLANAIDQEDANRALCLWSLRNRDRLIRIGVVAMERPESTPTWCHWQQVPVGSGVFCFWPSEAAYNAWKASGGPLMVP